MTTQTANKPARYLFDEVFALDVGRSGKAEPVVSNTAHEAAVAAAREQGYAKGVADGRSLAEETLEKKIADSLTKLSAGLDTLIAQASADRVDIEAAAVEMAHRAMARLAPQLIAREPAEELGALLRDCMSEIRDVPHVAIRVSETLVEDMRARADRIAAEAGFSGTVIVLGEPDMAPGDGRIEWADGGVVRDMTETMAAIDKAIDEYLAARGRARRRQPPAEDMKPDASTSDTGDETNE